jgi:hypothetical protein
LKKFKVEDAMLMTPWVRALDAKDDSSTLSLCSFHLGGGEKGRGS